MNSSAKRVLLVVSYQFDVVGGHLLSAVAIARKLHQCGYDVGVITHPIDIPDLDQPEFITHKCPYRRSIWGPLRRSWDILRIMNDYQYNIVITMDGKAADQAALAALVYQPFLVQIQPGGPLRPLPPVNLPGIIVFSEELLTALQDVQGLAAEYLVLSQGRVDFDQYFCDAQIAMQSLRKKDKQSVVRILTSSRLHDDKELAIKTLINQAVEVAQHQPLELSIVGDGGARKRLEQYANRAVSRAVYPLSIQFPGAWRVSALDVLQADLVVGQGNTVIESVAWGVPAAVCGTDGYFGLLTCDLLPELAHTNLTGRDIPWRGSLLTDLQELPQYMKREFPAVRHMCADIYDVRCAVKGVEEAITRIRQAAGGTPVRRSGLAKAYINQLRMYLTYHAKRYYATRIRSCVGVKREWPR